uniref:Uncharacterized protein n=1 Tax=Anguilla anguilla TaxID=7936 RepID=A0A0E9T4U9_ANGAN
MDHATLVVFQLGSGWQTRGAFKFSEQRRTFVANIFFEQFNLNGFLRTFETVCIKQTDMSVCTHSRFCDHR